MSENNRIALFACVFISIFLLPSLSSVIPNSIYHEINQKLLKQPFLNIKTSNYWNLTGSPIFIDDSDPSYNWSKTAFDNDWCRGNGSRNNPYIIENVTINGQGSGKCIEIINSDVFFIIRNCTLSNSGSVADNDAAIKLRFTNNGKLVNNNISYNPYGILLQYSYFNNISKNIIRDNFYLGLELMGSDHNDISFNNFSFNNNAIHFDTAWYNTIYKNIINYNFNYGLHLYVVRNTTISKNKIHNNTNSGIYLDYLSFWNTINQNEIYDNQYFGIETSNSQTSEISENNITNNLNGIFLIKTYSIRLFENNVSNNRINGIYILDSYDISITNNLVSNNEENGIYLENTNYSDIVENKIFDNLIGIHLVQSNYNNIIGNNVQNNSIPLKDPECYGNYFKDNIGIDDTLNPNEFPLYIIIVIVISLFAINSIGILVYKKRIFPKTTPDAKELKRIESEVSIEKEKHLCVVHRGKIVGAVYICPDCETYYCMKCARVLKRKNENCWACNSKIKI
ncbi:MAG: NosD domain-containing protein [Promethearchaeota archaeon]|jgi:parallel beta-helix repeat protein